MKRSGRMSRGREVAVGKQRGLARMSGAMRAMLQSGVRKSRRETVYRMLAKKHEGIVPCFVCGRHVKERNATLEHVTPLSKGGTDDMDNLAISHFQCNQRRGNSTVPMQGGVHGRAL